MSFDAFRKKKREKAIADDAKMGATYLGTSIKNAELGDTGNRPMKLPGAGSSESSNPSTTISSAPAINTSSKTAISDVATKVRDLESYRSTLENTRKQLQTSASNTDYMSQQRKLDTVNNLISSVESQLSDLKSQRPDYDRKEAQSKYDAYEAAEVELAKKYGSVEKLLDDIDAQYADLQRRERQLKETEKKVQENPADPVLQKLYKAQYQNYQNVFDKYQALYADLNGMQTAWAAYTDYGTAANDSLKSSWNRALQAMKGAAEGQVSGNADALTTAYAKGQKQRSLQNAELLKENQAALDKAKATLKEMVASRSKNPGSIQDSEIKSQQNVVADLQRKVDALAKSDTVQAQATGAAHRLADRIQEISSRDIQLAKEGTGKLGSTLLDTTVAGTQLGLDIITGRLLGIGGKSSYIDDLGRPATMNQLAQAGTAGSIAMRGFGAAAQQARQAGASVDEQVSYGLLSALLEVGTEKAMSVGKLNSKVLGKGALEGLEDALKEMVYAVEKQGKTAAGRAALNRLASMGAGFVSEGFEEGLAALIDPILQRITYSDEKVDIFQLIKDVGYDALVGGLLGMVTSGVGGTDTSKFRAAEADMTASVDTATDRTYNKPEMVSAAAAPEIQQAAAQVATVQAENPKTDVLTVAQTAYLDAGIVAKIPKAKRNAFIVQNLIEGKEVSNEDIDKLALSTPKAREVFTKLTGVQFPTNAKLTPELLRNLARSAHTVAQEAAVQQAQVAQVKAEFQAMQAEQELAAEDLSARAKQAREAVSPAAAEQAEQILAQARGEIAPDGTRLRTYKEFNEYYDQHVGGEISPQERARLYDQYLRENQAILFDGHRVSKQEFTRWMKEAVKTAPDGTQITDEDIEALWSRELDQQKTDGKDAAEHSVRREQAQEREQVQKSVNEWKKVLAKNSSVTDIILDEALADNENAFIDSNGVVHLNAKRMDSADAVTYVLGHELVHSVKDDAARKALVDDIIETVRALTNATETREAATKWYQDLYQKHEDEVAQREGRKAQTISMEYAEEEYAADLMREVFMSGDMLSKLAAEKPSLLARVQEILQKWIASLSGNREAVELYNELTALQDRFVKALQTDAAKSQAALERVGVEVDPATESARPNLYSLTTWEESDYMADPKGAAAALAKAIGVSDKKAAKYIKDVNSIAKLIADDKVRLDYDAAPGRSSFVGNSEYGGSVDFSTICKKRRLFTGTFSAIQKALPETALTADEMIDIRKRLKDKGYEVSCGLCYVEGSRLNLGQYATQFLDQYRTSEQEYTPTLTELTTVDGQENLRREHPEVYESYIKFLNTLAQRKPKVYQTATAYNGEILKKFGKDTTVKEKNKNGGLRLQSFSDFEIIHLIDNMQVIMDMARVGLAGQAYTKVPDFAWAMGNTGLKINLSLIAKDVDADGHLVFDDIEGMPRADAQALRDAYSDTVGTIVVVFNDAQLRAAMADDFVDYIIPFHRSQLSKKQYDGLGLPEGAKDYTPVQNESYIEPVMKNGKKQRPSNYMPNEYWDFSKTGKENAEAYLEMCAKNNRRPKFSNVLEYNGDGSYSLPADGSADGYWKLLIDFKMYNNEGIGVPQQPVKPEFNLDESKRMLAEYKGGHDNFPVAQDIVDEFVDDYKKNHPDARYSVDPDFGDRVHEWFDTTTEEERAKSGGYFRVGTTSKALQSIGIKDRRIFFGRSKIAKIVDKPETEGGHKGAISVDDIAKVPELLENPVAVLKSKNFDTSIIAISELKAASGDTLTAVVELNPRVGGGMDANIHIVVSAYDRNNENLRNLLKESEVLYLSKDKKRTDTWLMSLRVQFPSDQPMYGSIGSVAYEGEKVKSISGVRIPFVDLPPDEGKRYSINTDKSFSLDDYTIDDILKWSDADFDRAYQALGLDSISDDILLEDDFSIDDIAEELDEEPEKIEILYRRAGLGDSHIEQDRMAVMTQERLDKRIHDSESKGNPDYARKYITRISPKDFLDLTVTEKNLPRENFDTRVTGDLGSTMSEWDYAQQLHDSEEPPVLDINRATGQVIGHNGRHRVRALEMSGIEAVEIEVGLYDEDGYMIKYGAETIPDLAISSQFDSKIETHLSNVIPLNSAHRDEILSSYTEAAKPEAGIKYSITRPDLSFADQVDLVRQNKLNEFLEPGTSGLNPDVLTTSAVYVTKEPNPLMQELGYGDLAIVTTQEHIRQMTGQREAKPATKYTEAMPFNEHNHQLSPRQVKRLPKLLEKPAAVIRDRKRPESLVFVTTEKDYMGRPIIIPVKANGVEVVYDGVTGPAHIVTSMYGRDNFEQFFEDAVKSGRLVYYNKERIDPMLTAPGYQSSGLLSGIDSDTILGEVQPKVKEVGERKFSVTPAFEKWYKEQYGTDEELTNSQLKRRLKTLERRAAKAEESAKAAELKNTFDSQMDLTAWMIHHTKKMREQKRVMNEKLEAARKEKTAAVRAAVAETKELERAKAAVQHDADRMAERRNAAKRLRTQENAYTQKVEGLKENLKLKRNAARATLRNANLAAKKRAEIEAEQGMVDTVRKNPKQRSYTERLQESAQKLRTLGRAAYRNFVNQAEAIDRLSKRQISDMRAGTLVNILGGSASTVETIFKDGLVNRAGDRIGGSMKEVFLCWDDAGRKVDENKQALLQDFMLHWHNVDRMSIVARAESALETFELNNEWLRDMDSKEFARLVAMTENEAKKLGKQEAQLKALEYNRLIRAFNEAQNKPIFADSNGNSVTAETSQRIVQQYLEEAPWLMEKANGIYEWWDLFMREWAVGDTISEAEYRRMRQMYPHYAPTYRADKKGVGGAGFVGMGGATVSKAVKKAKGSHAEVLNIEDSFANMVSKIVRLNRLNELYLNIVDTAMLDDDGTFADMAAFDWESSWQTGDYAEALKSDLEESVDDAEKVGLEKVGQDYKLTAWKDGRKYTAFISEDLYKSIGNTTGHLANDLETGLLKIGNTLTGPMKTAITGINPSFAARNLSRDLPTAIVNSISGMAFPKYYAQAAAEMLKNSDNWQRFQALGGTHATYYNDSQGFAKAIAKGDGVAAKVFNTAGAFNEATESQTRFAEYLATIDRLGDTYEARLQGIKNAAEVTVDFSRKGRAGKVINAFVPYWNPAVQGIDKVVRSVIDSPDGSAIWKQASKTLGRAAVTSLLTEAVMYSLLKALDRDDEWEELNDRTKDTYYCIPLKDEKKFLKIPKNREWGAILGTPFMRMLEYANGRENPFENYIETAIEPNFLPPAIFRPDAGGGFASDIIGVSQALDLAKNEDFAGRTIVPYAQQQGSLNQQFDADTSALAKKLGELFNWSPMQIDYIIGDYFGDFGDLFIKATSEAHRESDQTTTEAVLELLKQPWVADARYSNQSVNKYYELMDELGRVVNDKKNQLGNEAYKETLEYQAQKAVDDLYGKTITELNKQVRGLPDGEEKDAAKEQIAQTAAAAIKYYEDIMAGSVSNPILTSEYADFSGAVSEELIRMDSYSEEYKFTPYDTPQPKYTDPDDKKREYILDSDQKDYFKGLYREKYDEIFGDLINSQKYRTKSGAEKAKLLEDARNDVLDATKEEFFDWLKKNGVRSTPKK